jgi:hypothetical protein
VKSCPLKEGAELHAPTLPRAHSSCNTEKGTGAGSWASIPGRWSLFDGGVNAGAASTSEGRVDCSARFKAAPSTRATSDTYFLGWRIVQA